MRVNGLDTHWCYRDVVDVVEARGDVLDTVLVPKVGAPSDVEFVGTLLDQIEQRNGWEPGSDRDPHPDRDGRRHGERRGDQPGAARPARGDGLRGGRLRGERAGTHDEHRRRQPRLRRAHRPRAATGARETHWGDQWHFGISRMVAACRAEGLRPIDGPFGDFNDADGYRSAARRAAALGCEGKWAIHPSQVALANEVFSPADAEVERARRILQAMEDAAKEGKGAVSLDGRLIDAASIRMAENLIRQVEQIESPRR